MRGWRRKFRVFFAAVFLRLCPCMTSLHLLSFSFFLQLPSLLQCLVWLCLLLSVMSASLLSLSIPTFLTAEDVLQHFPFDLCVHVFFPPSHVSVLHSHNNCVSSVTPFSLLAEADITRGYIDGDWQVPAPPMSSIYLFFTSLTSPPTAHCFPLTSDMNSTNQILKEGNECVCVCTHTSGRKQLCMTGEELSFMHINKNATFNTFYLCSHWFYRDLHTETH